MNKRLSMNITPVKILIVDNDKNLCYLIEECLHDEFPNNVNTKILSEVREAIDYINNNDIDVIITDINFPHFSGKDIIKEIQKKYGEVNGVIITWELSDEITQYAFDSGLCCLKKPLDYDELIYLITPFIDNVIGQSC